MTVSKRNWIWLENKQLLKKNVFIISYYNHKFSKDICSKILLCSRFTESVIKSIVCRYVHISKNYIKIDGHYQTVTYEEQECMYMFVYKYYAKYIAVLGLWGEKKERCSKKVI